MSGREWASENMFRNGDGAPGQGARQPEGPGFSAWITGLKLGEPQRLGPLDVVPLTLAEVGEDPGWLLAHEAIERGWLVVSEIGEGSVQQLQAENTGQFPVLVLEGETLVGCKQNRVVAHTVLVAAGAKVVVPVGCMERRRWGWSSERFHSGELRMHSSLRSATVAERTSAPGSGRSLDQGRLWQQVSRTLDRDGISSATLNYHEVISSRAASARAQAEAVQPVPGQVGIAVLHGERLVALELTAHPRLWSQLAPRTVPSLLLDDMPPSPECPRDGSAARLWLARLASGRPQVTPAVGLGQDVDVTGPEVTGAGLWHAGTMAHLAAFATT